jgi:hypothetical protein
VSTLVPCPRCAVQGWQNVLHMQILMDGELIWTVIDDGNFVALVKHHQMQLTLDISLFILCVLLEVRRARG